LPNGQAGEPRRGERSWEYRLPQRLTVSTEVRTFSRSKALKSGSRLRKGWPEGLFTEPGPVLKGALCLTLCSVAQAAHRFRSMTSVILRTPVDASVVVQGRTSKLEDLDLACGKERRRARKQGPRTKRVSRDVRRSTNGKRAMNVERRNGWLKGKSFEGRILWADVARNKATRLRWDQTAEKVRNLESGRCW
jgi:hypothetical protein